MKKQKIAWEPTEKQKQALVRNEFEILFGGARGGGKSAAGMAWLLYDIGNPKYRALVIRRNADDLKDWIDRARVMYLAVKGEVVGSPSEIRFPSGAIIRTGHLKDENAYEKYQGHEYHKILIEELTHIPQETSYLKLISSCRSTVDGLTPQIFCTTNPGSFGHAWTKRRFIDVAPHGTPYIDPITGRSRIFIPARVEDNPYLMDKNPEYVKFLEGLPDGLRQAWRYGDWESIPIEGAFFTKEITQTEKEGRITDVPYIQVYRVHTAWDIGINDPSAVWFYQIVGDKIRFIDYYENSGEGLLHYVQMLDRKGYMYGTHFAPHDMEQKEWGGGKTRKEIAQSLGVRFEVARKLPIYDGIDAIRILFNRLWFDKTKCEAGLQALRNYRREYDEKRGEFKAQPLHDWSSHCVDSLRTFAVTFNPTLGQNYGYSQSSPSISSYSSSKNYRNEIIPRFY